jgi:TRAP-type C4-dicarboxylate transport system permease small subunit
MSLSRRQRAAAASVAMIVVTVFSLIFLFNGWSRSAIGFEFFSAMLYGVWVYRGKDEE